MVNFLKGFPAVSNLASGRLAIGVVMALTIVDFFICGVWSVFLKGFPAISILASGRSGIGVVMALTVVGCFICVAWSIF